ncbi:hypothetical protein CY35_04G053600 [Sphagnum magellanicum]|nr:hypothetical protein CY35_04G053600 [Sphagnum magellanicum]
MSVPALKLAGLFLSFYMNMFKHLSQFCPHMSLEITQRAMRESLTCHPKTPNTYLTLLILLEFLLLVTCRMILLLGPPGILGLEICADTVVGNKMKCGVSRGLKRGLNTGHACGTCKSSLHGWDLLWPGQLHHLPDCEVLAPVGACFGWNYGCLFSPASTRDICTLG